MTPPRCRRGLLRAAERLALLAVAACSTEVNLGQRPVVADPDAGRVPVDAAELPTDGGLGLDVGPGDAGILDAGPLVSNLLFLANPDVGCDGAWAGSEEDFLGVPPAQVGLLSGGVHFEVPTSTRASYLLSGAPIRNGLGVAVLELLPEPFDLPAGYFGNVIAQAGPGPLGSVRRSAMFLLEPSGPTTYSCQAGVELSEPSGTGTCTLTYTCRLERR